MDPVIIGCIGIFSVFLLLALGMPIAFALMFSGFTGIGLLSGFDAAFPVAARAVYDEAATYPYMVIPLFIVMGSFAGASGMTKNIYGCLDKWLRLLPGGLAVASISACAAFAAVSGSSVATAATLGNIALPEMKRYKYQNTLSTGALAAGGTLGFLIPPSLGFVVYGMLTEQSIGKLLVAGILPGAILAITFCCVVVIWVKINPAAAPKQGGYISWNDRFAALRGIIEPIVLFCVVMFGIYGGLFTPTEAGAVGATLLFIIVLVKRKLTWTTLVHSLQEALSTSVMVLFLVSGASIFTYFLALSTIPMQAVNWVTGLDDGADLAGCFPRADRSALRPDLVRRHRGADDGGRPDHPAAGAQYIYHRWCGKGCEGRNNIQRGGAFSLCNFRRGRPDYRLPRTGHLPAVTDGELINSNWQVDHCPLRWSCPRLQPIRPLCAGRSELFQHLRRAAASAWPVTFAAVFPNSPEENCKSGR
jgi:tripartite ATP-independent transporter DctM subunit